MKKNNHGKVSKLLFSLPAIISAIALVPAIGVLGYNNSASKKIEDSNINADATNPSAQEIKPLVPSVANMYNAKLSSKNGPIVFWKDKITSLDWFGAERWSIDVTTIELDGIKPFTVNGNSGSSWQRYWLNFDLDKTRDILYVLSNAKRNSHQYAVSINVQTGQPMKMYKTANPVSGSTLSNAYFMLKVLNNGNFAFLGKPGNVGDGTSMDVVDIKTGVVTNYQSNIDNVVLPRPTATESGHNYSSSKNATFNIIPIASNRNLLAVYNLTGKPGTTADNGARWGTSDVWFVLVDDNLKTIPNATGGWDKAKLVTNAITNTRNSKTRPQCDYHVLLDGRVVTVIYDKLIIIDPANINNPTLAISVLEQDKWIDSWSFDSNETLFFKARNSSNIKQVSLDKNRNNYANPNHVISPYYNLAESPIQAIKDAANSLVLYNVYGYIGQIMLINSQYQEGIDYKQYPTDEQIEQQKYGLAVAITNNKNTTGQGDTKGLLNTADAFQKSADFEINASLLKSKLPSEITRSDITFHNDSFLTTNTNKNPDGSLMYEPFVKNLVDDVNKKLTVTLHLDQIPWFVTNGQMPNNIVPLKITKTYDFTSNIESRFSWKNVDVEDYDFKNTLPSKLTIDDIKRVNPLVSTLTSQNVTINGESYPKVTYSKTNVNDSTGSITIQAKYDYLPMELKANTGNLKSYTTSKTYTIFRSGTTKKFEFVGGNETEVSLIPELKEIKESNILPSVFANASKQEYLKFIDTNKTIGYPLEKMNISVIPNDSNGTLQITIDPRQYDPTLNSISKTFKGLNKTASYSLKFTEGTGFNRSQYLPSEINEEIFYQNFVTFSGFDASDLELELFSNDVNGSLVANIILTGDYPDGPTSNTDFKKENNLWIARKTLTGFKNVEDFNQEYQVQFKQDDDTSLTELQRLTPSEIMNKLTAGNLTMGSTTFTSKEQLAQYFIAESGDKIPKNIVNNKDVSVELYINNGGGELTWRITYNNLEGYSNSITFLATITGFVKGNQIPTSDILTFTNNAQLKSKNPSYFTKLPSEIKKMLDDNKQTISNFFLNEPSGGYKPSIDNGDFELTVIADDTRGNLHIKLVFNRNTNINASSLLEYNQTYTGFMYN